MPSRAGDQAPQGRHKPTNRPPRAATEPQIPGHPRHGRAPAAKAAGPRPPRAAARQSPPPRHPRQRGASQGGAPRKPRAARPTARIGPPHIGAPSPTSRGRRQQTEGAAAEATPASATADPAVGGTDPARRRPDPAPETGGGEERRGEVAVREEGVGEGEERRGRGRGRGEAGTRAEPTSAQPPAAAAVRTAAGGGGGPRRRSGRGEGRRRGVPPESPTRVTLLMLDARWNLARASFAA